MAQRKYCHPEDMIRFLLALCCQDDSSTAPVSRDEALNTRFGVCLREVTPVANSDEMRQKLNEQCVFKPSSDPSTFVIAFRSKPLSHTFEWDMYQPFAEALNYALERVEHSGGQVARIQESHHVRSM